MNPDPNLPRADARTLKLLAALVALAAVLPYLNSLANGFALDDVFIVQRNARVHDLADLREIWLTPYWPSAGALLGLYRPLVIAAFSVQWAIGGGDAFVFHLGNVLLHALASVLAFLLVRRFASDTAAAAGAVLFALHPLHTEAVANIVGQAELIAALCVLAAALLHAARPALTVDWPRRSAYCALLLLGMLAKESAITLPGLLVLLDFAQRRVRLERASLAAYAHALAVPLVLCALTIVAYLLLRISVLGSITGIDAAPAFPYLREQYRLLLAFRTWPEYLRLLFFPQDLAADYGPAVVLPVESFTPMVGLGFALLAAVALLALCTPLYPLPGLVAGWFLISVLTISNLFFPVGVLLAERTLYLPSVAVAFTAAFLWDAARRAARPETERRARTLRVAVVALVAALFGARTVQRNPDWKDTSAVLEALVRDHPEAYRAQWVLAVEHWRRGDIQIAEQHWLLAYRLWPRDSQFLAEYGGFHMSQRNFQRAIELLETARDMHPMLERTHALLAQAYSGAGRYHDALESLREARRLGTRSGLRALEGEVLYHLGEFDRAAAAWSVAAREGRGAFWLNWAQLARAFARAGRDSLARDAADRAARFATPDTLVQRTARELQQVIRSGCLAAPQPCADPLAGWSVALGAPPDSARMLQNARQK